MYVNLSYLGRQDSISDMSTSIHCFRGRQVVPDTRNFDELILFMTALKRMCLFQSTSQRQIEMIIFNNMPTWFKKLLLPWLYCEVDYNPVSFLQEISGVGRF